jgi:hypothetical protein
VQTKHAQLTWRGVVRQIREVETEEEGVRLLKDFFRRRPSTTRVLPRPLWPNPYRPVKREGGGCNVED